MTENEAIKNLQETHLIVLSGASAVDYGISLDLAVIALEEIQQYRAIGTVAGYERAIEISKENFRLSMEYKAKVQEYEEIGTVEEFKALKEKADLYEQAFYLLLKDDCKRLPEGWTGSIDELYVGRKQFYLDKVEKTKVLGRIKT